MVSTTTEREAEAGAGDQHVLSLDVGGTKLSAALISSSGVLSRHVVVPTPAAPAGDGDTVWTALIGLVRELVPAGRHGGIAGVGIGSAGPLDLVNGSVSPVNIPSWREFPLVGRVADLLPGLPVELAGDGICAAAGEHWRGAGRGTRDMLGLVVSTGIGGGLILDGRLRLGRSGNAGHVGHSQRGHAVVDSEGEPCPCGGRGCLETVSSGPSMVRWARSHGWAADRPSATARELAADARAGDRTALGAFDRGARALGAAIIQVAAICDLDHVVIGGGVAQAGPLLFDRVEAAVEEFARMDFLEGISIHAAELGGSAGLMGAAALLFEPSRYAVGGAGIPLPA